MYSINKNKFPVVYRQLFVLLQVATVGVFLGRAWQHLVWDAPFRALFWDEHLMSGWVSWLTEMTWGEYVRHPATDEFIQSLIRGFGWYYLLCAVVAIGIRRLGRVGEWLLGIGAIGLVLLAFLYYKEKFLAISQFFEYSLQFATPLFLIYVYRQRAITPRLILAMKIAAALTFIGHGLYALGYYPVPGHFLEMVINVIPVSETIATRFLWWMGIFDLLVSIGIFIPWRWVYLPAMAYMVIWGFFTAAARIWAFLHWEYWLEGIGLYVYQTTYRFPHFLVPLFMLLWYLYRDQYTDRPTSDR